MSLPLHPGDLIWVTLESAPGEADRIPHPHVVVALEADAEGLVTVVLCGLTSNLHRAAIPGNILLEAGEGGLPRQSVIEVGKRVTLPRSALGAAFGALAPERVQQIIAGMAFQQRLQSG